MEKQFNKYQFLRDLEAEIKLEIAKGDITNENEIDEYIDREIDNACVFNSDCFDICKELNATDFTIFEFGEPKNISQLAFYALYEYVQEEFDRSELTTLIEN